MISKGGNVIVECLRYACHSFKACFTACQRNVDEQYNVVHFYHFRENNGNGYCGD